MLTPDRRDDDSVQSLKLMELAERGDGGTGVVRFNSQSEGGVWHN